MFRLVSRFGTGALCLIVLGLAACSSPTPAPIALATPRAATAATGPVRLATRASAPTSAPSATAAPVSTNAPAAENPAAAPTADPQPSAAPPATVPQPSPVPPTTAPSVTDSAPVDYFGVSTNGELMSVPELRALATLGGVQLVRTSVYWSSVEGTKGTYDWQYLDSTLNGLTDNGFAPLVLIMNNPGWAASSACGPVSDLPAFEQFVRTLAARYPRVRYWALYNEPDNAGSADPNSHCFGGDDSNGNGRPDVADYAEQLALARRAVKLGNPDALMFTGALAFDNFNTATAPSGYPGGGQGGVFDAHFPEQLFQYIAAHPLPDGERYFDVLTFNFYDIYGPYWQTQAGGIGVIAKANRLRQLMKASGLDAPLMVGETGIDSVTAGNAGQSQYAVKTLVRGLASDIRHMVWWTYQDFPDSAPPPSNTWKYGLVDQNGAPKPAYAAYQTASHQLTGAAYNGPLAVDGGEGYLFTRDGSGLAVIWSSSDAPVTVAFAARQLQATDLYGAQRIVADGSADDHDGTVGRIGITVAASPVYVQLLAP